MTSEEWRDVVSFEHVYEVSSLGRVRRVTTKFGRRKETPSILKQRLNRGGYACVSLHHGEVVVLRTVHQLVLTAFVGPCPVGMEGAHCDGVRHHNAVGNLQWKTHIDNCSDKIKHGTEQKGERNGFAKLTADKVREIRALKGSESTRSIARRFGVCQYTIYAVHNNWHWQDVK